MPNLKIAWPATSFLLVMAIAPVMAQILTPPGRDTQRAQTQKDWEEYRINPSRAGHEAIVKIASTRSLPATRANATALLALLQSAGSSEDRAMLARMAGDLHYDFGKVGDQATQADIRDGLRQLVKNEHDPIVRKAAAFTYGRLGWFPDSMALLARSRPLLGDRDYYGELAHLLLLTPAAEQPEILKELEAGEGQHTGYAKEILANEMRSEHAVDQVSPAGAKGALMLLLKTVPTFVAEPQAMGVADLFQYSDWFIAVVKLTVKTTGQPTASVVANMVQLDGDPRKLIAIFGDGQSAALARSAMDRRTLDKVNATLVAYAARFASNRTVQGFVSMAKTNLVQPAEKS